MFSFLYHCQDFYRTWLYIWVTRSLSYKKNELFTLREYPSSPLFIIGGFVLLISSCLFCVVQLFTLWLPCCDPRYDDRWKRCSLLLYLQLFVGGAYVLFTLFVFTCSQWCPTHFVLCFWFVCLRLLYRMMIVSLNCPSLLSLRYFLTFINVCMTLIIIILIDWFHAYYLTAI